MIWPLLQTPYINLELPYWWDTEVPAARSTLLRFRFRVWGRHRADVDDSIDELRREWEDQVGLSQLHEVALGKRLDAPDATGIFLFQTQWNQLDIQLFAASNPGTETLAALLQVLQSRNEEMKTDLDTAALTARPNWQVRVLRLLRRCFNALLAKNQETRTETDIGASERLTAKPDWQVQQRAMDRLGLSLWKLRGFDGYCALTRVDPSNEEIGSSECFAYRHGVVWVSDVAMSANQWKSEIDGQTATASEEPSRSISVEVRREVWRRDGGRCVTCNSQERLEFDHIIPVALGGSNTARNIQLLCERCNRMKGASLG